MSNCLNQSALEAQIRGLLEEIRLLKEENARIKKAQDSTAKGAIQV